MLSPLLIVLGLALVWSIYWWWAIGIAREQFASMRLKLSSDGFELACMQEGWGGFPFRFEFSCTDPKVSASGRVEVQSRNLLAVALAYKPWHVIALIDGPTSVIADGRVEQLMHGRIAMSVQVRAEDDLAVSVEVPQLISEHFGSWSMAQAHVRARSGEGYDVAARFETAKIRTSSSELLSIDEASLVGRVDSALTLGIENISLKHGNVTYWGSGVVDIDHDRRLQGAISTQTNDLTGLLEIAEPHLGLNPQQQSNLKFVLGLLGKTAKIDLVARDGELYVGPFKVGDLKPLY